MIRKIGIGCALVCSLVGPASAVAAPPPGEAQRVLDVMSPANAGGGTAGGVGVLVRQVGSSKGFALPAGPVIAAGERRQYEPASSIKTLIAVATENSVSPTTSGANPAATVWRYPSSPNSGGDPTSSSLCPVAGDEVAANEQSVTLKQAQTDMLKISDNRMTRALLKRAGGWNAVFGPISAIASMPDTTFTQDFVGCAASLGRFNRTTLSDMANFYAEVDAGQLLNAARRDDLYSTMLRGYADGGGPFRAVWDSEAGKLGLTSQDLSKYYVNTVGYYKGGSYAQPCDSDAFFDLPAACGTASDQWQVDLSITGVRRLPFVQTDGSVDVRTYAFGAYTSGRLCTAGNCYSGTNDQTSLAGIGEALRAPIRDSLLSIKYPQDLAPVAAFGAPASPYVSEPVSFDGSASSDDAAVTSCTWDFGDGTTATGATTSHTYASTGSYVVELYVTDAQGKSDVTRRTVVIGTKPDAEPVPSATPIVPPVVTVTPTPDRTAPKLAVSVPSTLRRGKTASVKITLDSAATVRMVLTRSTSGRRAGRKCVAETKRNRKAKRCTRTVTLAKQTKAANAGATTIAFRKTAKLKRGRYAITVTATDAAGNVSPPKRMRLRVR